MFIGSFFKFKYLKQLVIEIFEFLLTESVMLELLRVPAIPQMCLAFKKIHLCIKPKRQWFVSYYTKKKKF